LPLGPRLAQGGGIDLREVVSDVEQVAARRGDVIGAVKRVAPLGSFRSILPQIDWQALRRVLLGSPKVWPFIRHRPEFQR